MKNAFLSLSLLFLGLQCNSQPAESSYKRLKDEIATQRSAYAKTYSTTDSSQRSLIVKASYQFLFAKLINDILPAWYGTPWTFHGHSETPVQGSIACGYFITTTLRDAGFNIPRVKWAQQASETVIRKLTTDVKRFHNAPIEKVTEYINSKGNGLYIVGLDCHVGFIVKNDKVPEFVHANYYQAQTGVMSEPLKGRNPLNDSKYRVVGKLLNNDMLDKWLTGYKYE